MFLTYADDITDDEIIDSDTSELALSEDKARRGDQVLESFHDFWGFWLLVITENSRYDDDSW